MNAVDEQRQTTAIRAALGTTDAEVTRAPGGGWLVRISDERAKLALDLYNRLGDAATADTFVRDSWTTDHDWQHEVDWPPVASAPGLNNKVIDEADDETLSYAAPTARSSAASGSAADRERYVTERATFMARSFADAISARGGSVAAAIDYDEMGHVERAFRDLIDRGVLK